MPPRPQLSLPSPGSKRAIVLGAGSFGTAVAVLLARVDAPVTTALWQLISGELPLEEWVAQVRATVLPPPARVPAWRSAWVRLRSRTRRRLPSDAT